MSYSMRPAEIRVIYMGNSSHRLHGIDVLLNRAEQGGVCLRSDKAGYVQPVHVNRLPVERRGKLLTRNQDECGIDQMRKRRWINPHIMVGDHEKVVPVRLVPPCYRLGRGVAIALKRMRVGAPLEPASALKICLLELTRLRP